MLKVVWKFVPKDKSPLELIACHPFISQIFILYCMSICKFRFKAGVRCIDLHVNICVAIKHSGIKEEGSCIWILILCYMHVSLNPPKNLLFTIQYIDIYKIQTVCTWQGAGDGGKRRVQLPDTLVDETVLQSDGPVADGDSSFLPSRQDWQSWVGRGVSWDNPLSRSLFWSKHNSFTPSTEESVAHLLSKMVFIVETRGCVDLLLVCDIFFCSCSDLDHITFSKTFISHLKKYSWTNLCFAKNVLPSPVCATKYHKKTFQKSGIAGPTHTTLGFGGRASLNWAIIGRFGHELQPW